MGNLPLKSLKKDTEFVLVSFETVTGNSLLGVIYVYQMFSANNPAPSYRLCLYIDADYIHAESAA